MQPYFSCKQSWAKTYNVKTEEHRYITCATNIEVKSLHAPQTFLSTRVISVIWHYLTLLSTSGILPHDVKSSSRLNVQSNITMKKQSNCIELHHRQNCTMFFAKHNKKLHHIQIQRPRYHLVTNKTSKKSRT